jgi:hypothetical protein
MLQVYVSSVSCFKRKLFGWDRRSHVVRMCRRGVWIPVCAHETEKARVVPACVREMQRARGVPTYARENGAGAGVSQNVWASSTLDIGDGVCYRPAVD